MARPLNNKKDEGWLFNKALPGYHLPTGIAIDEGTESIQRPSSEVGKCDAVKEKKN